MQKRINNIHNKNQMKELKGFSNKFNKQIMKSIKNQYLLNIFGDVSYSILIKIVNIKIGMMVIKGKILFNVQKIK